MKLRWADLSGRSKRLTKECVNMDLQAEWNTILLMTSTAVELHTLPLNNKKYRWFSAISKNGHVIITKSIKNLPSSDIKNCRKISYKEFEGMYPLYFRRKNGDKVSAEASPISQNQVYLYSLIGNYLDESEH